MTFKTMLTVVSSVVFGLSVQAAADLSSIGPATWFDTKISQYTGWPTTGVADMGGAWSNTEGATLVNNALELDTEANAPLTFAATDAKTLADTSTEMSFTASLDFTPFVSVAAAAVPADAKVGVIAVKDAEDATKVQYYVLAKDPDGATNIWTACGSAVTAPEGPVAVVITVNGSGVSYKIGEADSVDVMAVIGDGQFQTATFTGSGTLAAYSATETPNLVTFTLAVPENASVMKVMQGETELSTPYAVKLGTSVTVTYKANEGYLFANGTDEIEKVMTIEAAGEQPVPSGTETEAGKVKIGTTYYLTFAAAFGAAQDGDTITLCQNVEEAKISIATGRFPTLGLTIDLGGYTNTFNSGSNDCIEFLVGSHLTISNGTLAAASGTAFRDIIRFYGHVDTSSLTLKDVVFDGANLPAGLTTKAKSVLTIEGGNCAINGGSITAPAGCAANTFYAIKQGNHVGDTYKCGTLTLNCPVTGDILLTGGTYVEGAQASVTGDFYFGKNVASCWEDASNVVFAARIGELPATGAEDNFVGRLYKTFASAQAALATTTFAKTLTLLKPTTVSAATAIAAAETYDIGTGSLTIAADTTLTLAGTLKCADAGANFVNNGTLAIQPGAAVYMGAVKWFGADAAFANVTAGTLAQTKSTAKLGNKYVISADGRATIFADETLFNAYDDEYYLVEGAEVTVPNVAEATVKARFNPVDGTKAILVKDTNVYYVGTASTPITPGGDGKPYDTKSEAEAATNNFAVAIDPIVDAKLADDTAKATYKAMFKPVIVEEGGKFVVKADFTDQAKEDIQTAVDTATKAIEISEVASAAGASDIEIADSIPGLYYQLNTASELTPASFEIADEQLGDGDTITFKSVAKPSATKGFYKVSVTAAAQKID